MAKGYKTGGRKKGTPNKHTAFSKAVITEILNDYTSSGQFRKDLEELDADKRLDKIIKIMAFDIPKPQAVDVNITSNMQKTIEDKLVELSEENEG